MSKVDPNASGGGGREDWVEAAEAVARLGVRPQTLYAYVSRGRIEARADRRDPRRSLYRAADIAALAARRARGRGAADVARSAIDWGEPILASAITTVAGGRLYYRGRDAIELARTETFEAVARLLRGGGGVPPPLAERPPAPTHADARRRLFVALADRAAREPPRATDTATMANEAAALLDIVADAVIGRARSGPIHERLARAWGLGRAGAELVRRALVLLADHELNPSTFAARVAASAGASMAAAALAGLATLSGSRHGGLADEVAELADEADRVGPREAVVARLAFRPTGPPGVGHRLYPEGDPRARALLDGFTPPAALGRLATALEAETGEKANVDFALAALARALELPRDAPFCLFAVARCAGWTAHALEQADSGSVIRPRARYAGPPPTAGRGSPSGPGPRRGG